MSSSRDIFNLSATAVMIKLKKDPGKILRTDKECTNLYVLVSEKTILVLFGIQDQNHFTELEIVFDFFENSI
jgi:hypothetical protein